MASEDYKDHLSDHEDVQKEFQKEGRNKFTALLPFHADMLDKAVIWIDTLDKEGNVTFWNKSAEKISGYTAEEVVGHAKIWNWLYPDPKYSAKVFKKAQNIIHKGEKAEHLETKIRRKDGQYRTILWQSNNLIDDGKIIGSIALGIDITERKQAEEALRKSEKKLNLIFNGCRDAAYIHDTEGQIFEVNKAVSEHLGYSREELLNMSLT